MERDEPTTIIFMTERLLPNFAKLLKDMLLAKLQKAKTESEAPIRILEKTLTTDPSLAQERRDKVDPMAVNSKILNALPNLAAARIDKLLPKVTKSRIDILPYT
jgi:hypothetical protein